LLQDSDQKKPKKKIKKGETFEQVQRPKLPVAVICKVKFVSQLKKEVEF